MSILRILGRAGFRYKGHLKARLWVECNQPVPTARRTVLKLIETPESIESRVNLKKNQVKQTPKELDASF